MIAMRVADATVMRHRAAEGREFRAIYWAAFAVFLAAALVGRVLPRKWRLFQSGDMAGRSVFQEARAAAGAFVPFAMMG